MHCISCSFARVLLCDTGSCIDHFDKLIFEIYEVSRTCSFTTCKIRGIWDVLSFLLD